jgi:hypothetical protein
VTEGGNPRATACFGPASTQRWCSGKHRAVNFVHEYTVVTYAVGVSLLSNHTFQSVESCQHNTKLRHTGQRVSVTSPCVAVAMATPAPSTATLSSVESLLTDAVRHEDDVSEYAATHPHTHMTIVSICTHTATPFHPTVDFHATNLSHTARTLSTHVPEAMNSFMMPSLMSLRRRPGCLTHAHLLCLEFKRTLTYTHIELRQTQQANN